VMSCLKHHSLDIEISWFMQLVSLAKSNLSAILDTIILEYLKGLIMD